MNSHGLDPGIYRNKGDGSLYYVDLSGQVWNERKGLERITNFHEFAKLMKFEKYVSSKEEFFSFSSEESYKHRTGKIRQENRKTLN